MAIVLLGMSDSDINCYTMTVNQVHVLRQEKAYVRYSLSIDRSDQSIIFVDIRLRPISRVTDRLAYDGCPTHCIS